jgi:hypothetical protein
MAGGDISRYVCQIVLARYVLSVAANGSVLTQSNALQANVAALSVDAQKRAEKDVARHHQYLLVEIPVFTTSD